MMPRIRQRRAAGRLTMESPGQPSLRRQAKTITRTKRRWLSVRICTQIGRGLFAGRLHRRPPLLRFMSVLLNKSLSSICLRNNKTTNDDASVVSGSSAVSCNCPMYVLLALTLKKWQDGEVYRMAQETRGVARKGDHSKRSLPLI